MQLAYVCYIMRRIRICLRLHAYRSLISRETGVRLQRCSAAIMHSARDPSLFPFPFPSSHAWILLPSFFFFFSFRFLVLRALRAAILGSCDVNRNACIRVCQSTSVHVYSEERVLLLLILADCVIASGGKIAIMFGRRRASFSFGSLQPLRGMYC